ncbi:MAG: glycosyltransferase family 4 protein [Acidobacteria bacterium]|nr:glycosyltransferase family 4 protein [Acidobacteriota bacterium]
MKGNVGVYNLHMRTMGGGEKLTLALAEHLSRSHNVLLFHADPLDLAALERFFGVDLSRVRPVRLEAPGPLLRLLAKVRGKRPPTFSLQHYLQIKKLKLDLFINNSYASGLACPAERGVLMCMFPYSPPPRPAGTKDALVDRLEKCVTGFDVGEVVASYSSVVAISRYTAEWVGRMWGREAEVVYPPCEEMGPPSAKERLILHVGRFIADVGERERHHKGQGVLLETFKQMDELRRRGWELHFAGSVGKDEESAQFARALVRGAEGHAVTFHFDAKLGELRDLYRRAAVYWHATGFGLPAEEHPAGQEHFGITTVEAMSAGAVPVVYGSGGQKEIVAHGTNGFCWKETDELSSLTHTLADDANLRERLSRQAVASSRRFGRESFDAGIDRLVERLLAGV